MHATLPPVNCRVRQTKIANPDNTSGAAENIIDNKSSSWSNFCTFEHSTITMEGTQTNHGSRADKQQEVIVDEATLFASPLPITGERKTTNRNELWVSAIGPGRNAITDYR